MSRRPAVKKESNGYWVDVSNNNTGVIANASIREVGVSNFGGYMITSTGRGGTAVRHDARVRIRINGTTVLDDSANPNGAIATPFGISGSSYSVTFETSCTAYESFGIPSSVTASITFDVRSLSDTNFAVITTTTPSNRTIYRLTGSPTNGTVFFLKNATNSDEVYFTAGGAQTIDGEGSGVYQLASYRGLSLLFNNAFYILSFYDNALSNIYAPYTITKAQYGSTATSGGDRTGVVRSRYESGASSIGVNNGELGPDPQSGTYKYLWVDYNANGVSQTQLQIGEGTTFNFSSMVGSIPTASSSVVVMDITNGNKGVLLPSPSVGSVLVVVGYTTGTSTTNRINVGANGVLGDPQTSGVSLVPLSGPACSIIFVSNGTRWYIVGTFAGTNTVYDGFTTGGGVTSSVILSLNSTSDTIVLPATTNNGDSQVFFFKTTNIQYGNGAVLYSTTNAVNTNYGRFYRAGNTPGSSYIALSTKLAAFAQSRLYPVAMYPSEY